MVLVLDGGDRLDGTAGGANDRMPGRLLGRRLACLLRSRSLLILSLLLLRCCLSLEPVPQSAALVPLNRRLAAEQP